MRNKSNIKKYIIVSVIFLFVITSFFIVRTNKNVSEIENVLKTDAYSYLSNNAKEFLIQNYESTGTILLTEKNKEANKSYLNPMYIKYLDLSSEEKEKVSNVPSVTIVDFVESNNVQGSSLENYDLRDYSVVTPVRNQGHLGLCWAFATSSIIETKIMQETNTTYVQGSTQLINERQFDFATSINGIKDYDNEYTSFLNRSVGDGSNFYETTVALANGVTVVDYGWTEYDDTDLEPRELQEVLSFKNSLYEVNETINAPVFNPSAYTNQTTLNNARNEYVSYIKDLILEHGSAVVSTYYSSACIHYEGGDTPVLDVNGSCARSTDGHAMAVIGWDDNFTYDYCTDRNYHSDNLSGCSNIVSRKGAWILKNSWGNSDSYPYMAYTSEYSQFHLISDMSTYVERNWDNNYNVGVNDYSDYSMNYLDEFVDNGTEKLQYIKFMTDSMYATYSVKVKKSDGTTIKKSVYSENPGLVTVDYTEDNIELDEDSYVSVTASQSGTYFVDNISIFTNNINESSFVDLSNYDNLVIENSEYRFYSKTRNIPSGVELEYKLYSKDGSDVTSYISVENNFVTENNVNTSVSFNEIRYGTYTLNVFYNENVVGSVELVVPDIHDLEGEGTSDEPYLIYNESDLNQIRNNLGSHYRILEDIELTEEWVPIGTRSLPFTGSIDGDKHVIKNMSIESENNNSIGFIAYYSPQYDSYIRNITFEDAYVSNNGNAGILFGEIDYYGYGSRLSETELNVENVHFMDSDVVSAYDSAGILVGCVDIWDESSVEHRLNINNSFNNSYVKGNMASGYIGYIMDEIYVDDSSVLNVDIANFQNSGEIDSFVDAYDINQCILSGVDCSISSSPVIGEVYGGIDIELKNFIINSIFRDIDMFYYFLNLCDKFYIGNFIEDEYYSLSYENGFYVTKYADELDGFVYVTADELKNISLYDSWNNFDTYWKIETIDSIQRIPVLKDIEFDYTSASDIDMKLYDVKSLLSYVNGHDDLAYVDFENLDTDSLVADIDFMSNISLNSTPYSGNINVTAIGEGSRTVKVINNYDGFEKEININVSADVVDNPVITYYLDGVDSQTMTQTVNAGEEFTLMPNSYEKIGYEFKCWSTTSNNRPGSECYNDEYVFTDGITKNLKLYAQWDILSYSIKYDANGGTGFMEDSVGNYGTKVLVKYNLYSYEGKIFDSWNTSADGTGTKYNEGDYIFVDADVMLYAQWKNELVYSYEKYTVDLEQMLIDFVDSNTNLNDYKNKFVLGDGASLEIDTSKKSYIFTGGKTKFYQDGELRLEFTNIIRGDINGDGEISSMDYIKVKNHIMSSPIQGIAYTKAADITLDGSISSKDYIRIKNIIMEGKK